MYVLIEDDLDDEYSEICEVIESVVVTMRGNTHWHVSEGRRTVDMEETKQWFVQIDGVNKEGKQKSMLKTHCAWVEMAEGPGRTSFS